MKSLIGTTIGHYHIIAELGRGGRGEVYRADDTKLGRSVALKFLAPDQIGHDEEKARFIHEAQFAAALNHPNICTVHEIDEVDGRLFIVMEYIEGRSLKDVIAERALDITTAVEIAVSIAEGLREAHEQGIVHRDIKTANIMMPSRGQAKITDFGLAKSRRADDITREGTTLGTVSYMSPEQVRGEQVDHRSDLWSLGVILYEMLVGKRPFAGEYEQAVMYAILHDEPPAPSRLRPGVPHSLDRVVRRALARNVGERYHTAAEMLDDFRSVLAELSPGSSPVRRARRRRVAAAAVIGVALAAAAFVVWNAFVFRAREKRIDSIAVLPLENISKDPAQEYIADGMTDAIITELSRIRALRVISKTSVIRYRNEIKSLPEIARDLDVDAVVSGSTQLAGERVRITAQLIEARTDRHLWAESYDRELGDVLAFQKDVARAIASQIKVAVTPEEANVLASAPPIDTRAQDLYLRARFESGRFMGEGHLRAIELYRQALEIEPRYALACAGIAQVYDDLYAMGRLSGEEVWPQVRAWAARALEIDPALSEAHTLMGDVLYLSEWDFAAAERSFKQAIEHNPGSSIAHGYYGNLLLALKRSTEAMTEYQRALEIDPLGIQALALGAFGAGATGDLERALDLSNRIVALFPDVSLGYESLFLLAFQGARLEECAKLREKMLPLIDSGMQRRFVTAMLHIRAGERDAALEILHELRSAERIEFMESASVARLAAQLGETEIAFDWIERAVASRQAWVVVLLNVDPLLAPLRGDPRYAGIMRAIGLPE